MAGKKPKVRSRDGSGRSPEARSAGAALLVVDGKGRVVDASGWEALAGDAAPRSLPAAGGSDDPLLDGVAAVVEEARRSRAAVRRYFGVSLDKQRYYSVSAGPLPPDGKDSRAKDPDTAVLALDITGAFEVGPKEGESIRQLGHDLRTPLTSMSGAVELLQLGRLGALSPEQSKLLGMLQQGIDLMLSLIDEATAQYRAAAGRGSAAPDQASVPGGGAGR